MNPPKVVIYDPNWVNPYGMELSSIIAECGYLVDLWCTANRKVAPRGVRLRPRLPLARRDAGNIFTLAIQRALSPLSVAKSTPRKSPLVVVWTRDPWDAFVFAARTFLGGKTIFIYHNPRSVRDRGGWAGLAERLLLRVSTVCVVHSDRLAAASAAYSPTVQVAAHPPYRETSGGITHLARRQPEKPKLPIVAFVGAIRADKGADELVQIAKSARAEWVLRVLGPDTVSPGTAALLSESGVTCEYTGFGSGPTDDELLAGLAAADVMIAPYNSVTESGSIHLALSTNVPVLGYESDGVRHIINAESMAPNAERFGELLSRYFDKPWATFTPQATDLHQNCKNDWLRILNDFTD